ncbi:hypothetical protein AKJ16_DCAP21374, partial [Drosera capensis]
ARLQEMVEQLEHDKVSSIQREIRMREILKSLESERLLWMKKEVSAEIEDLNSQIEATCALVGKLMTENAELVEKVVKEAMTHDSRLKTVKRCR